MRVGAVLPQIEIGGDVGAVRAFTAAVDDLGFDHLLAYDHVLGAVHDDRTPELVGPYDEDDPFHDPLVLFGHLAALHPRLEYVTGILILPQRQTALVARQAADLAMLAPGGVRLGVAVGWNWTEYDALGQDFASRGARLDEQVPLLRHLWAGGPVTATVGDEVLDRVALVPAPPRPPEIWVGGFSEPAYTRGAALGDGFVFAGSTERVMAGWERFCELLEQEGRSVDDVGADWCLRGDTGDTVAERVAAWEEVGGTHASVVTLGLGFEGDVDAHIALLTEAADACDLATAA